MNTSSFIFSLVCCYCCCCCLAAPPRGRLDDIAARLDVLGSDIANFWKTHGPDTGYGGFLASLDSKGNKIDLAGLTDKGIIQQGRHLWAFSTLVQLNSTFVKLDEVKVIMNDLYLFISSRFIDPLTGRFYNVISEDGRTIVDPHEVLYYQAFAILGLSKFGLVTGNKAAIDLAMKCFLAIDEEFHDDINGGYNETLDGWWFNSPDARKAQNPHRHFMEALMVLFQATNSSLVKSRIEELVHIFTSKIIQTTGVYHWCAEEFKLDWTAVWPENPSEVGPGHDLKTAWYLIQASILLGRRNDQRINQPVLRIARTSALIGEDKTHGGFYELIAIPPTHVTLDRKTWWVQAEAINGLWWLYYLTKEETYLDQLDRTLKWIEDHHYDKINGEWFPYTDPAGKLVPSPDDPRLPMDYKGDVWKASYHSLRSMLFTRQWISEYLLGVEPKFIM